MPNEGRHLDIHAVASLCARGAAVETMLFEVVGGWVRSASDGAAKRLFAMCSHHHAWHAALWAERSPTIPDVDLAAASAVARTSLADLAAALAAPTTDGDRAAAYREVLTALDRTWRDAREHLDVRTDPSTLRVLDLVSADVVTDATRLEALVAGVAPNRPLAETIESSGVFTI